MFVRFVCVFFFYCFFLVAPPCRAMFNEFVCVCVCCPRALFDGQRKKLDPGFKPAKQAFVMCSFCSKSIASDSLRHGGCGLGGWGGG